MLEDLDRVVGLSKVLLQSSDELAGFKLVSLGRVIPIKDDVSVEF